MAAQEPRPTRVWVTAALGTELHRSGRSENGALAAELALERGPHHGALRGMMSADLYGEGDGVIELGALYGRTTTGRLGHAAVSAGAAYVAFESCAPSADGSPCDDQTLGIPLVAEAVLEPLPVAGLGVQAYLNLNPIAAFGGVLAIVQVGWLP